MTLSGSAAATRVTLSYLLLILPLTSPAEADENFFFKQTVPRLEQSLRDGRTVIWTLPNEATQYRPEKMTPVMKAALKAQREGRYLDALSQIDQAGLQDDGSTTDLLRASLYLQGGQPEQAKSVLAPLRVHPALAADAYALSAMAHLQQGELSAALTDAEHAKTLSDSMLPAMALSYALQGKGQLADARATVHALNASQPGIAVTLAREAELSLTLDDLVAATHLISQARTIEADQPYVVAVSGLVWLISGQTSAAKSAFDTALKRDPEDAKALMGLGLAEVRLGHTQAGLQALQAALEADPDNPLILTYLGRAQQQLGQTQQARDRWRQAQRADANDPTPWLYLAQAQLQANQPVAARESLRQAQARIALRAVYRGDILLQRDAQLLQSNLAETQRRLDLTDLAFQTLADTNDYRAVTLKDQAEILQGVRFAESARRSLVLQSLFNDAAGAMPVSLDVYGDGAGETGATTPQHGAVSGLTAQLPSYNDYGALFSQKAFLQFDGVVGSNNTRGEELRLGLGSDTLGLSFAQRQFASDGFARFNELDNSIWQGVVQWRPAGHTQAFILYENYHSDRGETILPADPLFGSNLAIQDRSEVTRLGLRHSWNNGDELHVLLSRQRTRQRIDFEDFSVPPITFSQESNSQATGGDVQYRTQVFGQSLQWGAQAYRSQLRISGFTSNTLQSHQMYVSAQGQLSSQWKIDWGMGWGQIWNQIPGGSKVIVQSWLPRVGIVFSPDPVSHLRLAAWQGLGINSVGNAGLAPISLAGIVQTRPGDTGKRVRAAALGLDRQLSQDWLVDFSGELRTIAEPFADQVSVGQTAFSLQRIHNAHVGLHWQPHQFSWAIGLSGEYEKTRNDDRVTRLDSLSNQALRAVQLDLRWFVNPTMSAHLKWSRNWVVGSQLVPSTGMLSPYADVYNQADVSVVWQLPKNKGQTQLGVRNMGDTRFRYIDPDPLSPRFSTGRLVYGTLNFVW